jgi:prevent-host-death family protein
MDKYVTATEANQRFSEILREVAEGESYTITSRGKPLAEITPSKKKDGDLKALVAFLKKQPVRLCGPWKREDLYAR